MRARKTAKTAVEPTPSSTPVTWIQVGPGKFVRVEGRVLTAHAAQFQEVATDVSSETNTPGDVPPALSLLAEPLVEQEPPGTPETTLGVVRSVVESEDRVSGSTVEEYGIAPSAFSATPSALSSVEHVDDDVPAAAADPGSPADLGGKTSWCNGGPVRLGLLLRGVSGRTARISQGIATGLPRASRLSSRPIFPNGRVPRASGSSSFAKHARLRQASGRAFGRVVHLQRTRLPRSPPSTSTGPKRRHCWPKTATSLSCSDSAGRRRPDIRVCTSSYNNPFFISFRASSRGLCSDSLGCRVRVVTCLKE